MECEIHEDKKIINFEEIVAEKEAALVRGTQKYYEPYTAIKNVNDLKEFLPPRPYCCKRSLEYGLTIRPREDALKAKYIQLNSPFSTKFLTFDIDRSLDEEFGVDPIVLDGKKYFYDWQYKFFQSSFPAPSLVVQNRENGHAHFIYVLTTPVHTTDVAHIKPLRYLEFIRQAYTVKLGADLNYSGLISKNPFNKRAWQVTTPCETYPLSYTLEALASPIIDYGMKPMKESLQDIASWGRNCHVLATVGNWAYSEIRKYWSRNYGDWEGAVYERCEEENMNFPVPLYAKELAGIARSIARWTTRNITPEGFSEWQRRKAKIRWDRDSKKKEGLELLKEGRSIKNISELLGVSKQTVKNWKREC